MFCLASNTLWLKSSILMCLFSIFSHTVYHLATEDVDVLLYVDFVRHGVLYLHLINSRYMISERDTADIDSVT